MQTFVFSCQRKTCMKFELGQWLLRIYLLCSTYSVASVLCSFQAAIVIGENSILDHQNMYMHMDDDTENDEKKSCSLSQPSAGTYSFMSLDLKHPANACPFIAHNEQDIS